MGKTWTHTARNAIKAAVEMHQALAQFNQKAKDTDQPELDMGIGIHIGNVVIGNSGHLGPDGFNRAWATP